MLVNSFDVIKYVRTSAGRRNLNVVFEDVNRPRHDGNTIYLPKITSKTTEDDLKLLMASTDHEVAHDEYSDFDLLREKNIDCTTSVLGMIWNALEDSRVNSIEADKYEGFRQNWDTTCVSVLENFISIMEKGVGENLEQIMLPIIAWDCATNEERFPALALVPNSGKDTEGYKKLLPFTERLKAAQTIENKQKGSLSIWELSRDIYRVFGGDPDKEEKKVLDLLKAKPETGETGGSGEEDIKEDVPFKEDPEFKLVNVDFSKVTPHTMTEHSAREKEHNVGTINTDKGISRGLWFVTPLNDYKIVDYSKQTAPNPAFLREPLGYWTSNYAKFKEFATTTEAFSQQVRRLIQIQARTRYEHGVKRCKLDQSRLSRICIKDGTGFQDRIFKRTINSTILDAAVTILVDMSGSMSGEKTYQACISAVLINDAISTCLNVPTELLGFTDSPARNHDPLMFIYKDFNTRKISEEQLVNRFGSSERYQFGNPDGECILFAYNRLLCRKERKKLLIVLSDGSPAASKCTPGIEGFTKDVIAQIEKQKKVDIYGIGIIDDSVQKYYKHHSVIQTASDIAPKLLEVIERKLLNV